MTESSQPIPPLCEQSEPLGEQFEEVDLIGGPYASPLNPISRKEKLLHDLLLETCGHMHGMSRSGDSGALYSVLELASGWHLVACDGRVALLPPEGRRRSNRQEGLA